VVVGTLTISLGIACFPGQGETAAALIEAADQALYQAKRGGRNCIVCSEVTAVEAG
jgi:diguanylate cyclase (GGDEF)-like protein